MSAVVVRVDTGAGQLRATVPCTGCWLSARLQEVLAGLAGHQVVMFAGVLGLRLWNRCLTGGLPPMSPGETEALPGTALFFPEMHTWGLHRTDLPRPPSREGQSQALARLCLQHRLTPASSGPGPACLLCPEVLGSTRVCPSGSQPGWTFGTCLLPSPACFCLASAVLCCWPRPPPLCLEHRGVGGLQKRLPPCTPIL